MLFSALKLISNSCTLIARLWNILALKRLRSLLCNMEILYMCVFGGGRKDLIDYCNVCGVSFLTLHLLLNYCSLCTPSMFMCFSFQSHDASFYPQCICANLLPASPVSRRQNEKSGKNIRRPSGGTRSCEFGR